MRIGSLCSGVGLFELGLIWAGLGDVAWQCEILPFCRRILHKQYPESKVYDDVQFLGFPCVDVPEPVDLICFGSPCQDLSSAGEQAGLDGARSGIFYDCARVVAQLRPEWVVVENVASGAKLLTASRYGSTNNGKPRDGRREVYATAGTPSLDSLAGSSLNPRWCEYFMGAPSGWTEPGAEHEDLPLFKKR